MPTTRTSKITYGIDPGTHRSAIVGITKDFAVVSHEYLDNRELEDLLLELSNPDDELAIEWLQSYGMAVGQDVFLTCRWVGRFERCWGHFDNVYLYARPTIRSHILGGIVGKKKGAIRQALMLRFGGTKKREPLHGISKHKWDALAVSVYHLDGAKLGEVDWARIE